MTAARNSEGVQYRYTYDTKGNPQDVVIHHDRVSTSVMAGRSYYIRHRKSGKYIDVKDASNKDGAAVQQYEFREVRSRNGILRMLEKDILFSKHLTEMGHMYWISERMQMGQRRS